MKLIPYVSLFVCTWASGRKSVSFNEPAREVQEIPASQSSDLHIQLVSTLLNMGLEKVSEDLVEGLFISLVDMQKDGDTKTSDEQIDQVIDSSLFNDQSELSFGDLLDLIGDNVSTMSDETRCKFQSVVRKRYENLPLNDQGLVTRLYSGISTRLGL